MEGDITENKMEGEGLIGGGDVGDDREGMIAASLSFSVNCRVCLHRPTIREIVHRGEKNGAIVAM